MASATVRSPTRRGKDLVDIGADVERDIGDHLHQALEQIVARDEIGFGIHLDDDALVRRQRDADQALGGDPAGLLGGLGQPLLAQPVDRGFEIAAAFAERRLAIHHARAGLVAELLHHARGDVCHCCQSYRQSVVPAAQRREALNHGHDATK